LSSSSFFACRCSFSFSLLNRIKKPSLRELQPFGFVRLLNLFCYCIAFSVSDNFDVDTLYLDG
jgi:hypothetical protein